MKFTLVHSLCKACISLHTVQREWMTRGTKQFRPCPHQWPFWSSELDRISHTLQLETKNHVRPVVHMAKTLRYSVGHKFRHRVSVPFLQSPFPLSSCEASKLYKNTPACNTHWQIRITLNVNVVFCLLSTLCHMSIQPKDPGTIALTVQILKNCLEEHWCPWRKWRGCISPCRAHTIYKG